MGTYRFILALMVLLSHALITWWGYNPGVVAVISFFVISGYSMAATIRKNFSTRDRVWAFYADRLLRIFPQYLLHLGITAALFSAGMIASESFLSDMGPRRALMNLPILPLGIPRSTGFDITRSAFIPQAWSLALELTFYAVVPLLLLWLRPGQRRVVAMLSCFVALLAMTRVIEAHDFAYATLPGTLFIFMIGMNLHDRDDQPLLLGLGAFAVGLCVLAHIMPNSDGLTRSIALGIVLALGIVPVLTRITLAPPLLKADRYLGDLSYGVFLNHFIFIWLMQRGFGLGGGPFRPEHLVLLAAASVTGAALSLWVVESPIRELRLRRRLLPTNIDLTAIERVGPIGRRNADPVQRRA